MNYAEALNERDRLQQVLDTRISSLAREIAQLRGQPLAYAPGEQYEKKYYSDGFERDRMGEHSGNTRYAGVYWPIDYELGTPTIKAKFGNYVGDGYCETVVEFPEFYLDCDDWRAIEQPFVDLKNAADAAQRAEEAEGVRRGKRALLEKLKRELGE